MSMMIDIRHIMDKDMNYQREIPQYLQIRANLDKFDKPGKSKECPSFNYAAHLNLRNSGTSTK